MTRIFASGISTEPLASLCSCYVYIAILEICISCGPAENKKCLLSAIPSTVSVTLFIITSASVPILVATIQLSSIVGVPRQWRYEETTQHSVDNHQHRDMSEEKSICTIILALRYFVQMQSQNAIYS